MHRHSFSLSRLILKKKKNIKVRKIVRNILKISISILSQREHHMSKCCDGSGKVAKVMGVVVGVVELDVLCCIDLFDFGHIILTEFIFFHTF